MMRTLPHWRSAPRHASLSQRPVRAQGVLFARWRHSCRAASFRSRSNAAARSGTILLMPVTRKSFPAPKAYAATRLPPPSALRISPLAVIAHRLDARAQPFVRPLLQRGEETDLLERRGAAVHHRRSRRDARQKISERRRAVEAIREVDAAPLELPPQPGDSLRYAPLPGRRLDAPTHPGLTRFPARPCRREKNRRRVCPTCRPRRARASDR